MVFSPYSIKLTWIAHQLGLSINFDNQLTLIINHWINLDCQLTWIINWLQSIWIVQLGLFINLDHWIFGSLDLWSIEDISVYPPRRYFSLSIFRIVWFILLEDISIYLPGEYLNSCEDDYLIISFCENDFYLSVRIFCIFNVRILLNPQKSVTDGLLKFGHITDKVSLWVLPYCVRQN